MSMARLLIAAIAGLVGWLLLIPLVVLAAPFWLIRGLTAGFHHVIFGLWQRFSPWHRLIEYAPVLGWRPRPGMRRWAFADKPYRVRTDAEGWRGSAELSSCDVVVFGDSYAFGYGVDDEAFFAERADSIRIKSIGVNGYSMVQPLLLMESLAKELRGKVVVWFVYHGNDLLENLCPNLGRYRMPFVRREGPGGDWRISVDHVNEHPWEGDRSRDYYGALAQICTPTTQLARDAFSACEYLIRKGKDICTSAGADLVVLSIPDILQISDERVHRLVEASPDPAFFDRLLPDSQLESICARAGVGYVTLMGRLTAEDHKERDPHWNEVGHQRVAALLESLHSERRRRVNGTASHRIPVLDARDIGASVTTQEPGAESAATAKPTMRVARSQPMR